MSDRAHRPKNWLYGVLAFLVPVVLLLCAYASIGVFPFGEKTLLLVDMDNEYIDYFAHLHRSVREHSSLLRAWEMGMGLNMLGLVAFYTASPLNVLFLLFPLNYLTEAVLLLTLLKIGLCGLLFYRFARCVFGRRLHALALLGASVAYALCGYNLAYSSNIMWLDGVAFLPLVLLGAERLLKKDRWGLFAASLVYVFLSSYYIGYMAGIFAFLFFTARYFADGRELRAYWRKLFRFLMGAVLAAGCCAFLLLPAFLGLKNGQNDLWNLPVSWSLDISLTALAAKLLPGAYDSLTDAGLPHIYSTVAGVLGAILFFGNRRVSRRERLCWGAVTAFIILSFSCDILNLGWHAFEDPTWFPARYSFVFSFLLLFLALRGLEAGIPRPPAILAGGGFLLLLFIEAGIRRLHFVRFFSVYAGLFLAAAYCGLALLHRKKAPWRRAATVTLVVLIILESGYNARAMVQGMEKQFGYKTRESYMDFREQFQPAVDRTEELDRGIYRMEVVQQRNANGGMALGYRGISHYSTTTDQSLHELLRCLGYNTGTINELRCTVSTPLTNGLLGIKYLLSREDVGGGYRHLEDVGRVGIYENQSAFPLAFVAGREALSLAVDTDDPFVLQNRVLAALGCETQAFIPLQVREEPAINLERKEADGYVQYAKLVKGEEGRLTYTVYNPLGHEAYAYLPVYAQKFAKAVAYVDGKEIQRELGYRHNSIIPLGAGESIRLELKMYSDSVRLTEPYFYALDAAVAEREARRAQGNAVEFSEFGNTRVIGTAAADEAGTLVTTFPYDQGWTVRINGEEVPSYAFADVFLAAELPQGVSSITMIYWPPGFRMGCVLSLLSILVWGELVRAGRNKKDDKKQ